MFRRGLFYTYLSIYLKELGLTITETTLFATLPMIFNISAQTFVWGPISDRFQLRRKLIMIGELLGGLGTILVWYYHSVAPTDFDAGMIVIYGLTIVEFFWASSNVGWTSYISDVYNVEERSKIQGQLSSMGGLGRIFGIWIGGLLYDGFQQYNDGWGFAEGPLFFVAASVMFLSIVPLFFMPEGGISTHNSEKKENSVNNIHSNDISNFNGRKFLVVFSVFIIAMVFINFGKNSNNILVSQYLTLETGFNLSSVTLSNVVNVQSISMIISGMLIGRMTVKYGDSKLLTIGTITGILGLIAYAIPYSGLEFIIIGYFLKGIADVIIMASSYTFVSVLIPAERRAKLFSVFNATFFLSWGVAGTLITGPIADFMIIEGFTQELAYQTIFIIGAIMMTIGMIIFNGLIWYLNKDRKRFYQEN